MTAAEREVWISSLDCTAGDIADAAESMLRLVRTWPADTTRPFYRQALSEAVRNCTNVAAMLQALYEVESERATANAKPGSVL